MLPATLTDIQARARASSPAFAAVDARGLAPEDTPIEVRLMLNRAERVRELVDALKANTAAIVSSADYGRVEELRLQRLEIQSKLETCAEILALTVLRGTSR